MGIEHSGHTYGCFGFISQNRGVTEWKTNFCSSCVVFPSFDFDFILDLRPISIEPFWSCGFISGQCVAKSLLCSGARTRSCASRSSTAGSGEPFRFLELFFSVGLPFVFC
jgi:hypothetical protein